MANRRLLFKIPDIIIILLAIGLTVASAFSVYAKPQDSSQVLIQGQRQKWIFPMDAEETVAVAGPLGNTVVKIHNGQAWVEYSPCDNQTCVASGYIRQQRAWAACLPNNVFLIIEGNDGQGNNPDAVAW
ncbi:MAG: NusG domain II-containing protein [Treponema sp.]|nr:NusG domain II-containing protein [Treponema sp.]